MLLGHADVMEDAGHGPLKAGPSLSNKHTERDLDPDKMSHRLDS